jgi:hypothetical protein
MHSKYNGQRFIYTNCVGRCGSNPYRLHVVAWGEPLGVWLGDGPDREAFVLGLGLQATSARSLPKGPAASPGASDTKPPVRWGPPLLLKYTPPIPVTFAMVLFPILGAAVLAAHSDQPCNWSAPSDNHIPSPHRRGPGVDHKRPDLIAPVYSLLQGLPVWPVFVFLLKRIHAQGATEPAITWRDVPRRNTPELHFVEGEPDIPDSESNQLVVKPAQHEDSVPRAILPVPKRIRSFHQLPAH